MTTLLVSQLWRLDSFQRPRLSFLTLCLVLIEGLN